MLPPAAGSRAARPPATSGCRSARGSPRRPGARRARRPSRSAPKPRFAPGRPAPGSPGACGAPGRSRPPPTERWPWRARAMGSTYVASPSSIQCCARGQIGQAEVDHLVGEDPVAAQLRLAGRGADPDHDRAAAVAHRGAEADGAAAARNQDRRARAAAGTGRSTRRRRRRPAPPRPGAQRDRGRSPPAAPPPPLRHPVTRSSRSRTARTPSRAPPGGRPGSLRRSRAGRKEAGGEGQSRRRRHAQAVAARASCRRTDEPDRRRGHERAALREGGVAVARAAGRLVQQEDVAHAAAPATGRGAQSVAPPPRPPSRSCRWPPARRARSGPCRRRTRGPPPEGLREGRLDTQLARPVARADRVEGDGGDAGAAAAALAVAASVKTARGTRIRGSLSGGRRLENLAYDPVSSPRARRARRTMSSRTALRSGGAAAADAMHTAIRPGRPSRCR